MNTTDPAQWLTRYDERLTQTADRAREAGELLGKVTGSARSPRGDVSVTVNASGALERLNLTAATRMMDVDELSRLIIDTANQARQSVAEQVNAITGEYFGDGEAPAVVKQHQPKRPADRDDDDYFDNPPEITS